MQHDQAAEKNAQTQNKNEPMEGDRLASPTFIVSAGSSHKRYVVHEDFLAQSPVLARMCKGNFKEAHERHIVLPDDDPVDVGIMVECLYTRDFWTGANAQMGVSRQDSAIRLANLYTFAEKYDLTTMKDIVAKKIPKYTDIEEPEHWLAVAEIIYAAIPEGDHRYPKILRSLVVRFMNTQTKEKPVVKTGKRTKNTKDALLDWTAKGGRLATDISRGSREYWVRRIRDRDAAIKNKELWHKLRFNESNLDSEGSYDEDIINGTAF